MSEWRWPPRQHMSWFIPWIGVMTLTRPLAGMLWTGMAPFWIG